MFETILLYVCAGLALAVILFFVNREDRAWRTPHERRRVIQAFIAHALLWPYVVVSILLTWVRA